MAPPCAVVEELTEVGRQVAPSSTAWTGDGRHRGVGSQIPSDALLERVAGAQPEQLEERVATRNGCSGSKVVVFERAEVEDRSAASSRLSAGR